MGSLTQNNVFKLLVWPFRLIKLIVTRRSLLLFFKSRVYQISEFLNNGKYIIDVKKRTVYKNDRSLIPFFLQESDQSFNNNAWKQCILNSIFSFGRIKISNIANNDFVGNIVLFSNKKRDEKQFGDLKIFNVDKKKILSSYNSIESYRKRQKDTLHFDKHFLLPLELERSDDLLITIEEMIEFIPQNNYQESDYLSIAKGLLGNYCRYFRDQYSAEGFKTVKPISFFEYNEIHPVNHKSIQEIGSLIDPELLHQEIPLCYQHGDLSASNILYTNTGEIYLIDWEHASHFSFLYDVMWFWQNEAIFRNNSCMIEHYLSGGFDKYMIEIFNGFKLKYSNEHRLGYFLIMMAEFILHRVLKNESTRHNAFLTDKVMPMIASTIKIYNKISNPE